MAIAAPHFAHTDLHSRLGWLRRFAKLSDSAFQIPGTRISIGLDGLIGLVPGIGDVATAAASLYMIDQARQLGISKATLARMVANVTIDALIGAVPFIGDIFDIGWKANTRNLRLIEDELETAAKEVSISRLKIHEHV